MEGAAAVGATLAACKGVQLAVSAVGTAGMPISPHDMVAEAFAAAPFGGRVDQDGRPRRLTCLVVGTGISGIACMKVCLQSGIQVVAYEMGHHVAGFWKYNEDPTKPSVYRSVHIDTPRDVNSYGDRPWEPDSPVFVHNSDIARYLEANVKEFDLERRIVFNRKVTFITQQGEYFWRVDSQDVVTGAKFVETFDAVQLCTGRHGTNGFIPAFPGLKRTKIPCVHSNMYKYPAKHGIDRDAKVVVVGIGNSGSDIVVEVGQVARDTVLVSRSGCWIAKHPPGEILMSSSGIGRPFADAFFRLPWWWQCALIERLTAKNQAVLNAHGLRPKHRVQQQHQIVTGLHGRPLHDMLKEGKVRVKKQLVRFEGDDTVVLADEQGREEAIQADLVVFATGFRASAGFVDQKVLLHSMDFARQGTDVPLYKGCIGIPPANSSFRGAPLLFCNYVQTATFMGAELQARLHCLVLTGHKRLPSIQAQIEDMAAMRDALATQYIDRDQLRTQHGIAMPMYYDELAEEIGAKPSFIRLLLERPTAIWHWYFGGSLLGINAIQYRLVGPGAFKLAEKYIEQLFFSTVGGTYKAGPLKGQRKPYRPWIWHMIQQILLAAFAYLLLLAAKLRGYTTSSRIRDRLEQNLQYLRKHNLLHQHSLRFGRDSKLLEQAGNGGKTATNPEQNRNTSQTLSQL